jgi:hypothetical protein
MKDMSGANSNSFGSLKLRVKQHYQRFEDMTVPHRSLRWAFLFMALLIFFARIIYLEGFYVVTYGMCIHLLYLTMLMITPLSDPDEVDEAHLPTSSADEFKPFVPKVQEFVVWRSMAKVLLISFTLTLFSVFDIPVFWPILVMYFIILFASQMGSRIQHMLKHKYVPWSAGKPKYVSKD